MNLDPAQLAEVRALFEAALAQPPESRAAVLAEASLDPALVAEAAALVAAHDATSGTFSRFIGAHLADLAVPISPDLQGHTLGAYRVIGEIGHGGMGTVYEAVRADDQFTKRVAIKTLRGGTNSVALLARFRQEREIQATLAHPNIAMLLDAGLTDDQVPYIVLEYVDGLPIDAYCEQRRLGLQARLDLFRQVIEAVRHAHQRLVVHRDLKPSNILVTQEGVVKLLDFGISKLLDNSRDHTATVGPRAFTTAYASPEQIRGEAISTATDVYSLGVVLYRLLTGRNPFESEASNPTAAWVTICEETPPLPSVVATKEAAQAMGMETPRRLRQALHGELDAIVLMALRKEPERRYATVDGLGEDLLNHLKGLPVQARPDSARYRFGKLIARNRLATAALGLAFLAMAGGTAVSLWQARAARRAAVLADEQRRTAQRTAEFLQDIFASADPSWMGRGLSVDATIGQAIDLAAARIDADLADEPAVAEALHKQMVSIYTAIRRPTEGKLHARRVLALQRDRQAPDIVVARSLHDLGLFYRIEGLIDSAHPLLQESYDLFERAGFPVSEEFAFTLNELGLLAWEGGRMREGEAYLTRALDVGHQAGIEPLLLAIASNNLGVLREALGNIAGAEEAFRQSEQFYTASAMPQNYERGSTLNNLAMNLIVRGKVHEAEVVMREALSVWESTVGPDHPSQGLGKFNLARILVALGRPAEALKAIGEARIILKELPPTHRDQSRGDVQEAAALLALGRLAEAEQRARRALETRLGAYPPTDGRVAEAEGTLGRVLTARGNLVEARTFLTRSLENFRTAMGADHPRTLEIQAALEAVGGPPP